MPATRRPATPRGHPADRHLAPGLKPNPGIARSGTITPNMPAATIRQRSDLHDVSSTSRAKWIDAKHRNISMIILAASAVNYLVC